MSWEYRTFAKRLGDVACPNAGVSPLGGGLPSGGAESWRVAVTIADAVARILRQQSPKGWEPAGPSDGNSLWRAGRVDLTSVAAPPPGGAGVTLHAVHLDCRRHAV
jgi:hypothetical protein